LKIRGGMIESDDQLMAVLRAEFISIIDVVTMKLLDKLSGDSGLLEQIVYSPYNPSEYSRQGRTGGLLGEWDKTNAIANGNIISSEITEYPDRLNHDPEDFIHGSNYSKLGDDIREVLSEIVFEGKSGPFWGEGFWRSPRDAWTPFIALLDDGTVDKMLENEFRIRGIKYIKGSFFLYMKG